MATSYGPNARKITPDLDNLIQVQNCTVLSNTVDENGSFVLEVRHDTSGCGGQADTGVFVELKDFIPWTNITAKFETKGAAACWCYMNGGGYNAATGIGYSATGNLLTFDATKDRVFGSILAFEQPGMIVGAGACNNDATNFMRYNTTVYRTFWMTRRRNVNGSLAGVHHGRSCNDIGANAVTKISNIIVW